MPEPPYGTRVSGTIVRTWEDDGKQYAAIELSAEPAAGPAPAGASDVSLPPDDPDVGVGSWPAAADPMTMIYPHGGKIEMGEREVADGPTVYLSLSAAGADGPSLILYVDPISFQPMIALYNRSEGYRTYPLDKIIRSPMESTRNPFAKG